MHRISLSSTLAAAGLIVLSATAQASVVYQAPDAIGGYCPTCAGTATQLGDDISLANGPSTLTGMTWDTANFGSDYDADIRLDLYNVDTSGSVPGLGSLFHTQTSTHFLSGGDGDPSRTFVDITIPSVDAPQRFIYTVSVENNNGSTNWNITGDFANSLADEQPSAAEAIIGTNHELGFFWGDWDPDFGKNSNLLTLSRLDMGAYQLGLSGNEDFADHSFITPAVSFTADVPVPTTIALLLGSLAGLGILGRRRQA